MLVYRNKGKEITVNGNEIEIIDVKIKEIKSKPYIPFQYVSSFEIAKIKIDVEIEIIINGIVVDSYGKKITIGENFLNEFEEIEKLNKDELFELVNNYFENEKNQLIEIVLNKRIK